ncbi:hypothetical protein [Limnoglobus roseus]|uniref:Uncharacterized protein n=1 Tax=Limnoglobus roseus TaxID=2598579 RepID=A0A5C1AMV8_9BACT|nr:hypothetical protein [Limnoglobus roseus]QEL19062.1 hypothetical protein PX52LOC_06119 [Limnoglobus roseus]
MSNDPSRYAAALRDAVPSALPPSLRPHLDDLREITRPQKEKAAFRQRVIDLVRGRGRGKKPTPSRRPSAATPTAAPTPMPPKLPPVTAETISPRQLRRLGPRLALARINRNRLRLGRPQGVSLGTGPIREGVREAVGDKLDLDLRPLGKERDAARDALADRVRGAVEKVFRGFETIDHDHASTVTLPGERFLHVQVPAGSPLAHVTFYQAPAKVNLRPEAQTASAPRLQRGTLDFLRHLRRFATELHAQGIPIGYSEPSDKRRAKLYGQTLAEIGFTPDPVSIDPKLHVWQAGVPAAEQERRFADYDRRLREDKTTPERLSRETDDEDLSHLSDEKLLERFATAGREKGVNVSYPTPPKKEVAGRFAKVMEEAGYRRSKAAPETGIEKWVPDATPHTPRRC